MRPYANILGGIYDESSKSKPKQKLQSEQKSEFQPEQPEQ